MSWEIKSDRPIYSQLVEQLELKIFSGAYPAGSKLPSVRDLAEEASVNPNTMQRALARLEEDGLIITHRTSGRSITEDDIMINKAKKKLAEELVRQFFENMLKMGFDKKEVLVIINDILEEGKNE